MGVEAFVFDCGGVLLRDGNDQAYRHWEKRLGLAAGELKQRLWAGEAWRRAERGELSETEFWQSVAPALGLEPAEALNTLADDLWASWALDQEVLKVIDSVRERYRVAMLSNATDALEQQLTERYGVADRFEAIVNSSRVGVAKPASEIYRILLDQLELEPEEVVFIDDRPENVAAAAALGLHVIWFIGAHELHRQLSQYLDRTGGDKKGVDD